MPQHFSQDYPFSNIINYIRKSRKDEEREKKTGEDTLSEQRELMTNFLNKLGLPYEQRFEIGSGDKISKRPVFKEVIQEIRQGKFDAIAVKEISRLGRGSYTDMGQIYDLITTRRVFIVTPYKTYDPTNDSDLRQIRFEMFLSREEFESIRTRLIGAKYTYALQGKFMGGNAPYGYDVDKRTMKLVINEEKAKVVQYIYDMYINGIDGKTASYIKICDTLTNAGIPTPTDRKVWRSQIIRFILTNPVYKGEIRYRQTEILEGKKEERDIDEHIIVPNAHEVIISEEDWEKAQELFNYRKSKSFSVSKTPNKELTGLVRCSGCGYIKMKNSSVRSYTKLDGTTHYSESNRLRCYRKLTDECGSVDYDLVLKVIEDYIVGLGKLDEESYKELSSQLFKKQKEEPVININENIDAQLKKAIKRKEFIFEQFENMIYTVEEFNSRKIKIDEEIEKLEQMKNSSKSSSKIIVDYDVFKETVNSFISEYNHKKVNGTATEINELLKYLINEVLMKITEKGKVNTKPKFDISIRLNNQAFSSKSEI